MRAQQLSAEAITAIIFDPIPQPARTRSLSASRAWTFLTRQPATQPEPELPPVYRSLDEAIAELRGRGLPEKTAAIFKIGVNSLMTSAIIKEEKESGTFNRKTDVTWNKGDAYLGLEFNNTNEPLAKTHPYLVRAVRNLFLQDTSILLTGMGKVSVTLEDMGLSPR